MGDCDIFQCVDLYDLSYHFEDRESDGQEEVVSFEELTGEKYGFQGWVRLLIFFIPVVYSQQVEEDATDTILSIASPSQPYVDGEEVIVSLTETISLWRGTQQD